MTPRERTLAMTLLGFILLAGGGFVAYQFLYSPLVTTNNTTKRLEKEVEELSEKADKIRKDAPRLAIAKQRSLPADESVARAEYYEMMSRLLTNAGVTGFSIQPKTADNKAVPVLAAKKPAYTKLVYDITFKKADMWQVMDFLVAYYKLNLLHQITAIHIKKEDDGTAAAAARQSTPTGRHDLSVVITTEAIIVDGASDRKSLLSVPMAFAAVGGLPGQRAVNLNSEVSRGITPVQLVPVLATKNRDYSLLVQKDMFHGPLPPPPPFRIARLPDLPITVGTDYSTPVRVQLTGEGAATGATIAATTTGNLFPAGSIKVDPKTWTITLPPPLEDFGSATVNVVATSTEGKTEKASFKVSMVDPKPVQKAEDDISFAILLTQVHLGSDGRGLAYIRDNASKQKYEIVGTPQGVVVSKFFFVKDSTKKDPDYDTPDLLIISDTVSTTKRTFKVVAMDYNSLILADIRPEQKPDPKAGPGTKGPGGPLRPAGRVPNAKAGPAAVAGNLGAAFMPPKETKYYRWTGGQSLAAIKPIPATEAAKIVARAAANGPIGAGEVVAADAGSSVEEAPPPTGRD